MTGFDAGLPGGDLGLVLILLASTAASAVSLLRLGYNFLLGGGPVGLGGPDGRGGAGRAGGGRSGGVFLTAVSVVALLLLSSG